MNNPVLCSLTVVAILIRLIVSETRDLHERSRISCQFCALKSACACVYVLHDVSNFCFRLWGFHYITFFFMAHSPRWARVALLSRLYDHTQTHHTWQDSYGRVIRQSHRPLPDNTQHSQETDICAPCGIRTRNPSKRMASEPNLRLGGHLDRPFVFSLFLKYVSTSIMSCLVVVDSTTGCVVHVRYNHLIPTPGNFGSNLSVRGLRWSAKNETPKSS